MRCPGRPTCRAGSRAGRGRPGGVGGTRAGRGRARGEPIYTARTDLVAKYPTLPDAKQFRVPNIGFSIQKAAVDRGIAKQFPLILSSGRLVEEGGGGGETRPNTLP